MLPVECAQIRRILGWLAGFATGYVLQVAGEGVEMRVAGWRRTCDGGREGISWTLGVAAGASTQLGTKGTRGQRMLDGTDDCSLGQCLSGYAHVLTASQRRSCSPSRQRNSLMIYQKSEQPAPPSLACANHTNGTTEASRRAAASGSIRRDPVTVCDSHQQRQVSSARGAGHLVLVPRADGCS